MVRIPQPSSIEDAIRIYYEKTELHNEDIRELFGSKIGSARIVKLKNIAREKMIERKTPIWDATAVNTEAAYAAWGLNIEDLERRYNKLQKLILKGATT